MKKKRYWVFGYDEYYPGGGMNDFIDSFDTYEEAEKYLKRHWTQHDYFEVYDLETDATVCSMTNGGGGVVSVGSTHYYC